MITLICPECRRENEPERIYCHECGARLDRSTLAKVAPKREDAKETHRRLKAMLDPQRAKMRLMFFKVSKVVLGACVVAALVQMLLPPDVPPRLKASEMTLSQINLDLENATMSHNAAPLHYDEAQVNAYLSNALRNKKALNNILNFERALITFDENLCRITVERSYLGFSFFTATSHMVTLKDGTINASNNGGAIGRLPIHPVLMKYADIIFHDLWTVLDREKKLVAKMGAIEFHPKTVILTPKP